MVVSWGRGVFPSVLINRLNKIESAVFLYCRFSLFREGGRGHFPDHLEMVAAVVVLRGVGKISLCRSIQC